MSASKYPIHRLPLPAKTLQSCIPQLELDPSPVSQRRATTFKTSTEGIWARVNPLWASWPLRVTKEELLEMGVDVDAGQQVNVEDVLKRWDAVDSVDQEAESSKSALQRWTSDHRLKLESYLLGVSQGTLEDSLPQLDASSDLSADSEANTVLTDVLSGRHVVASGEGSYGPWSTRYCGHQFGVWAGQLGDGRAISLLETTSDKGGRQEIQLKGGGRTPFSRTADGLAVLRSGVREYLGCEAIAALDIPTTRALALLTAPSLPVMREYGPEPTSLTARIAPSFIRIGHFEALSPSKSARDSRQMFFGGQWRGAAEDEDGGPVGGQGNLESLGKLVEWCKGIMGELGWFEGNEKVGAKEVFDMAVKRNAEMVAGWQAYGFCHGVINTDNVSILGLTIDYGPYAFMDVFDENHICNHSDPSGLYSYANQPPRIVFALDKLYQALAPLIGYEATSSTIATEGWSSKASSSDVEAWRNEAEVVMKGWEEKYWSIQKAKEKELWMKRFGLKTSQPSDDRSIIQDFLSNLHAYNMDFHTSFRRLAYFSPPPPSSTAAETDNHLSEYITSFVQAGIVAREESEVTSAIEGWTKWFKVYGERISAEEDAWGSGGLGERKQSMLGANPRFVLRQWVLEELIKGMEAGVKAGDEAGKADARAKLARILAMSASPYETYGEEVGDGACPTPEVEEERRLCGLGSRNMLGFQCSCSS